ncbi:MAG: GNAT family N-acetyltransferase [Planctomycetota bacterium]
MLIQGKRVHLRYPTADDKQAWCDLIVQSEPLRGHWVPGPQRDGGTDAPDWLRRILEANAEGRNVKLLVVRNEDGGLLGMLNFNEIVRGSFQNAYLGYWIAEPRKGYMSEAMLIGMRWAFEELGLHRLEANIQPENEASIELVKSLGFRREGYSPRYLHIGGEWRDHERWAITREMI